MDARREELLKRRKALLENKQKPESLKDKVLRYGIKDPAAGFGEFGNKILNIPSNVASFAGKPELAEQLGVFKNYDYGKGVGLPEEQNIADMLIRMAPEIAEGMAIPGLNLGKAGQTVSKIPKVGKYIQKILSESIPQAGLAGALSQPEDASEAALTAGATQAPFSVLSQLAMSSKPEYQKLFSTLGGIAGGALGGYGLHELGAPSYVSAPAAIALSALGSKGLGTKAMMMQEHAGGKNMPLAEERMKAAERIGLDFLTPEEAFNSPFLARKQGRLGKTDEGSELMYEKFQKRVESEQNAINAVLKEIHDPEIMGPQAKKLYQEAYPESFTPTFAKGDEIIEEAIKNVTSKAAYKKKLKNIPEDTIGYWDLVKENLYDSESALKRAGHNREAKVYEDTRKQLVEEMDEVNSYINEKGEKTSAYKEARGLEERKFAREGLEEAFDKTNINSGHAFFKALNSKEDFEDLMKHLRNVPDVQSKLKDMRELFKDFRKESTINKVRGLEQVGMKQDRNDINKMMHSFENMFTKGKFDKEAIEFITSKDWHKQLEEVNKISDKQKRMAKVIEIFGKGIAQANAQRKPFMETENYEFYD